MRRREFLSGLGGASLAWPPTARAQQRPLPVIVFLHSGSPDGYEPFLAALRQGLSETGYVEGRNLVIEYRWAGAGSGRFGSGGRPGLRSLLSCCGGCPVGADLSGEFLCST
jgi:hypothetical protein